MVYFEPYKFTMGDIKKPPFSIFLQLVIFLPEALLII